MFWVVSSALWSLLNSDIDADTINNPTVYLHPVALQDSVWNIVIPANGTEMPFNDWEKQAKVWWSLGLAGKLQHSPMKSNNLFYLTFFVSTQS